MANNDKLNLSIKVDHNIRLEKKDNVLYQILSGNKYEGYLWNKIFDYRIIKKYYLTANCRFI